MIGERKLEYYTLLEKSNGRSQKNALKDLNMKQAAGFLVCTGVTMKSNIYWDITPCSLLEIY
jgi:hypothetical protein